MVEKDEANDVKPVPEKQKDASKIPVQETREEIGGVDGPEPTRFGDWEKKGRCIDF